MSRFLVFWRIAFCEGDRHGSHLGEREGENVVRDGSRRGWS